MDYMKRAIILTTALVLALAFCFGGCSQSAELVSKASEKLSPVIDKAKELLPTLEDLDGLGESSEEDGGWSLPSLSDFGITTSKLRSTDDVALVPTDDYAMGYVFEYDGEQFTAYFDTYSWRVYDSYKITNHNDIVIICQALINEHPVYGSDWASYRTADDMAYEWEQHNLAYKVLPKDSHWIDDAKDVDLDPDDQGKSFQEIYESRTGEKLDIRNYLPGE